MTTRHDFLTLFDPSTDTTLLKFSAEESLIVSQFKHMSECKEFSEALTSAYYRLVMQAAVPHKRRQHDKIVAAASMLRAVIWLLDEKNTGENDETHK